MTKETEDNPVVAHYVMCGPNTVRLVYADGTEEHLSKEEAEERFPVRDITLLDLADTPDTHGSPYEVLAMNYEGDATCWMDASILANTQDGKIYELESLITDLNARINALEAKS